MVAIQTVKPLLHAQVGAMRTACTIQPGSFIHSLSLDDKCVIIHPFAHGIAEPPRFGILGKFPAVGPDDAPDFAVGVKNDHGIGPLKNLSRSEFMEVVARESLGITGKNGIV
jgi:hypothetical protein